MYLFLMITNSQNPRHCFSQIINSGSRALHGANTWEIDDCAQHLNNYQRARDLGRNNMVSGTQDNPTLETTLSSAYKQLLDEVFVIRVIILITIP